MLRSLTMLFFTSAMTLGLLSGCNQATKETPQTATTEVPHLHADGDELVWEVKEKIEGTEFEIWFGHHGTHFHGGDGIEPAVAIMLGGKACPDAKVFNGMVDPADAGKVIGQEVATVYEPETEEELAHYAQGELVIPKKGQCVIRFRIDLPGHGEEITRDVKVNVGH